MMRKMLQGGMVAMTLLAASPALAEVLSVTRIEFGPANTLFVADWRSASVHAVDLPPVAAPQPQAFNLLDLQTSLERELKTRDIVVEDLKTRPGTGEVYLALSYGTNAEPAIFSVSSDGTLRRVDLARERGPAIELRDAPSSDASFWGRTPLRSMTVSAMRWHGGKLYIAGLSNQTFSSSLRVASYPSGATQTISSIGIYHTSHGQIETRAPIRTMTFMEVGGVDYLIAAYMCTPLVAIPVSSLRDGAHISGKTIAELGYGNTPVDMVSFTAPDEKGTPTDYLTVTNVNRNAETIPIASIRDAVTRPGLDKMVPWSDLAGVDVVQTPLTGALGVDNLDDKHLVYVRRDVRTGALQLVSLQKTLKLRVSDYISEYDFPDYRYPSGFQTTTIKPVEDDLMREEGYVSPTGGQLPTSHKQR